MKLLYVDAFAHAVNPTATLMPLLARTAVPDCVLYGPGFVSRKELEGGILRFAERSGPFDAVLFGPNVPLLANGAEQLAAAAQYLERYTALSGASAGLTAFFRDVLASMREIPASIKMMSFLNMDYYAMRPADIERLDALHLHILGPNEQFVTRLDELPDYAPQERHYQRKAGTFTDAFSDFVTKHPERVVTGVHFIADTEFAFRHIDARAADVGVPGVEYVMRARGAAAIRQSKAKIASKRVFHLYRVLRRLGLPMLSRFLPQKLYQLAFARGLLDTKLVYTARGAFGMPIRKFFEIPAAGALMVCVPPTNFAALGFRDGQHYVAAEPEVLPQLIRELLSNADKAAKIARSGQDLVFAKHSLAARARQFRACLDALTAGTYRGADWVDGQFSLRGDRKLAASLPAPGGVLETETP